MIIMASGRCQSCDVDARVKAAELDENGRLPTEGEAPGLLYCGRVARSAIM
jgi:hypothetical protein